MMLKKSKKQSNRRTPQTTWTRYAVLHKAAGQHVKKKHATCLNSNHQAEADEYLGRLQ